MNIRDRGYLRQQRSKKIKDKKKKIEYQSCRKFNYVPIDDDKFVSGKLNKCHYGYLGRAGTSVKTNTRKGHASYRHKGVYGKADNYKRHDYQQIERMNIDENEYKKRRIRR